MPSEQWTKYYDQKYKQHKDAAIWLLGGCCVICGSFENLEFDHINRETKTFTIGAKLHYSWSYIYPELRKCQLLCTTCHQKKTAKEGPWNAGKVTHGKQYAVYILKCRCNLCLEYMQIRNRRRRVTNIQRPQTKELIHGTRAGYLKEKRRKLEPCEPCRLANAAYTAKLRKKRQH